jgi:Uma2 family endonuclease
MRIATLHTPEEVLQLDELFELVDGRLVQKRRGFLAGQCVCHLCRAVGSYLDNHPIGKIALGVTFQCFPNDESRVRRPDIALIAADHVRGVPHEGHLRIAPDVAIEVISPGDTINEFEGRLADYHAARVKQVWEVNPTNRYVRIHFTDRSSVRLGAADTLVAPDLLPGFSAKVAELMPGPVV